MTESTPPEEGQQQPLTRDQFFQLLERAESDPEWRQLLYDDPELAMREANFPEAQKLEQQGPPMRIQEREMVGQGSGLFKPWD